MNREELLTKLAMELGSWPVYKDYMKWDGDEFHPTDYLDGNPFRQYEWINRRIELINKPSWDEAVGTQVEMIAQNASGDWFWFDIKPKILEESGEWVCGMHGYYFAGKGEIPKGHDWRKTLERRPSTGTQYDNTMECPRCGGGYFPEVHDECPCKPDASTSDGSTASYYELPEGATELQDLISYRNMNAQMGEIQRAVYRYGMASHSDQLRDAKKIKFYIEAEIARLERYGV